MQRKLSAILAADVVGYSRLMEADEAEETFTTGPSSERAFARVAVANSAHNAQCRRCRREHRESRESRTSLTASGCGLSSVSMTVSSALLVA